MHLIPKGDGGSLQIHMKPQLSVHSEVVKSPRGKSNLIKSYLEYVITSHCYYDTIIIRRQLWREAKLAPGLGNTNLTLKQNTDLKPSK